MGVSIDQYTFTALVRQNPQQGDSSHRGLVGEEAAGDRPLIFRTHCQSRTQSLVKNISDYRKA